VFPGEALLPAAPRNFPMTNETRIIKMAAHMVAFAIKGRKVTKAEKAELMKVALSHAEGIVAKHGAQL
jgi:hypothetical protein